MTWWLALPGCWELQEELRHRRVEAMAEHDLDVIAARDAIARGDLRRAQAAGRRLAGFELVLGVPGATAPWIDHVRQGGAALERAVDLPSAASDLLEVTAACARCHTWLGVTAPPPGAGGDGEGAWTALLFESEEHWRAGVLALGDHGADLANARTWSERRAAFARRIAALGGPASGTGRATGEDPS